MGTSVLKELEELRTLLETPKKTFTPLRNSAVPGPAIRGPPNPDNIKTYSHALNSAEKSVDRLGRAIEAAEEEMEAALKRTTDVHRSQLTQKEMELQELQRVIATKERSIDSLRDTLATTKRTYESRLSQAEAAIAMRDAENKALQEELRVSRMERDNVELQLQRELAAHRTTEAEAREREQEFQAVLRSKGEEAVRALAALRHEKKDREQLRFEAEDARRQVQALSEELRIVRHESLITRERLEADLEELKKRYHKERSLRKASEKWLRAELRSREEMELLLSAVKDAAAGKVSKSDVHQVERLIETLRAVSPARGGSQSPPGLGGDVASSGELQAVRTKLEDDNRRLKAELLSARKMLSDRLRT